MSLNMPDFYKQPSSWKNLKLTLVQVVPAASSLQGFFFMTQNAWEELWVLSCFLWEADDLSGFFSLRSIPPPKKKTRKSRKNCRANLSLKKVMVQPIFTWLQPFGPVKITPKTPAPNRPIVRPLRIWNSELPSYLRDIFWTKIHPRWPTRKSRGNLKWKNKKIQQPGPSSFEMPEKMCQFTMTLAGFSLSNPTGRCWSSKLHLSSMSFIASGTFQTKGKKTERGWYISFGMLPPSYSPLRSFLS